MSSNLCACSPYLNLFVNSPTILGSISTAITFFPLSKRSYVKFPVPGPISKIISDGFTFAFSTILFNNFFKFLLMDLLIYFNQNFC